jgi:hypothetical protein
MNKLFEKLDTKEPKYALKYKEMITSVARLGDVSITTGSREEQYDRGRAFAYVYEFYMYALALGLRKELRTSIRSAESAKFLRLGEWKPKEMARYLSTLVIGHASFQLMDLEGADDDANNNYANEVNSLIEEFANGGLEYLFVLWSDNRESYADPTKLVLELISD